MEETKPSEPGVEGHAGDLASMQAVQKLQTGLHDKAKEAPNFRFYYHPASGAGPCRTYDSDKQQLSVGETLNLSPRAGCARCACPVR